MRSNSWGITSTARVYWAHLVILDVLSGQVAYFLKLRSWEILWEMSRWLEPEQTRMTFFSFFFLGGHFLFTFQLCGPPSSITDHQAAQRSTLEGNRKVGEVFKSVYPRIPFTFRFHALEKEMATHSSVLDWRIPGTGGPGGLLSMGSHRVGHDWSDLATILFDILAIQNINSKWLIEWKWKKAPILTTTNWSGLPCPPPGDHPNPGIEPRFPALQVDSLPAEPREKKGRDCWRIPPNLEMELSVKQWGGRPTWGFYNRWEMRRGWVPVGAFGI